jgi:hypothetical protein
MFAQYRLKRQLIKLMKAYDNLTYTRDKYIGDFENSTDDTLTREAIISKYGLEILKVSIYFDELKEKYTNFNTITSHRDQWKLRKPSESEGTVFFSTFAPQHEKTTSRLENEFNLNTKNLEASNAKPWLKSALATKELKDHTKRCKRTLKKYSIKVPIDRTCYTAYVVNNLEEIEDTIGKPIDLPIVKQIAAKMHINIFLPKEPQ